MNPGLGSRDPYAMQASHFEQIRQMVYEFCGVDLRGKQVLVGTRLSKKVRDSGFSSFDMYCEQVRKDPNGPLFSTMIDALTTNHTSFFREEQHFEFLRNVILPELSKPSRISIWSAACSSGEEPYTIAFSLFEALGVQALSGVSILASDVSLRVLEYARRGMYPASRLQSIPAPVLHGCLLKGFGQYEDFCLVKPEIRSRIEFRQINLLEDCSALGPFDVIFCRNVMIYFDQETQQRVVNKLASRLVPGGYLLIGHSESLNGIEHPLHYVRPATYRKAVSGGVSPLRAPIRGRRA